MFRTRAAKCVFVVSFCLATFAAGLQAQLRTTKPQTIAEPPEMLGHPPAPYVPNPLDTEFIASRKDVRDEFTKENIGPLEAFVAKHPDYLEGYYWRATAEACNLKPPELDKALDDLNRALSRTDRSEHGFKDTEALPIIAKIQLSRGEAAAALKTMTAAMMMDLDSADSIFMARGVKPEATSDFCTWNLTDLAALKKFAPHDWRPAVLEALYYRFFTSFDESFYELSEPKFEKAALIDPHSAIPVYLLGKTVAKSGFMSIKAASSDAYRDQQYHRATQIYTKAINIDPAFAQAYDARAEMYLNLKQSTLAIKDFDKVLSIHPDSTDAHSDRGLAELDAHQYAQAIIDFDFSLEKEKPDAIYVPQLYENRADAYLALRNPRMAIEDYSSAIRARLQTQIPLISIKQFRALYPEYDGINDDELVAKLSEKFDPAYGRSAFRKMVTENDGKWAVSLVNELYEKRGSAYIELGDFRLGILDYQRIFKGMPNFASSTERWQSLGEYGHSDQYFLDAKASEISQGKMPMLWVKAKSTKKTEVMAFELDCSDHRMRLSSSTSYDQNDAAIPSPPVVGNWLIITPDTLGEQLWNGVCSNP